MAASSTKKLIENAQIIPSKGVHRYTIIWIYGLGGNADGYTEVFIKMQPPNTRIILPKATKRWVTILGRQYYLESWWERDDACVEEGTIIMEKLKELIDDEIKLVKNASNIIIGGFSQGGCISLTTGLTYSKQQLGGIICCGGIFIKEEKLLEKISEYSKTIPILSIHGKKDDIFKWDDVEASLELLKQKGVGDNMEVLAEDDVAHIISPQGFDLISKFIKKQFKI
ncbi:unnamed protein product [Adineta steineri]|uniref:palmitoyl-protein hydrolase n=1 Tax=Adineta steineri TaxID=433720 RepID=A0A814LWT9_9BILA|nr:unnamed protein product [Adineta steineri]CAF1122564.1 unnamed protein product [Adineta steineri]